MGENTGIEWAHSTFNPWVGCTKVSPACDHCYAEGWAKRAGEPGLWTGDRRRTSEGNWQNPLKWNKKAEAYGVRRRVFCASLADVFDNQVPDEWRADLWKLIDATPHLDWMLLTKRPQNIAKMLPANWGAGWPNVWLGMTAENQTEYDRRILTLLRVPAAVHFLSCEPLLGPIMLGSVAMLGLGGQNIDWVIAGGESGPGARPMHPNWARWLRDECRQCSIPFFFKQWGDWAVSDAPTHWVGVEGSIRDLGDGVWATEAGMANIGKKKAGCLLDEETHHKFPKGV